MFPPYAPLRPYGGGSTLVVETSHPGGRNVSDSFSRRALGPVPTTVLVLAGLALIGFTGGASTALAMGSGSSSDSQDVAVAQTSGQAGIAASDEPSPPVDEKSTTTTPSTSTAPAKSESLPSSTNAQPRPAARPVRTR